MRRRLEALAHVALLLAALLACGGGKKDDAEDRPPSTEPFISAKAADVSRDYKQGEDSGNAKWRGKSIRIAGVGGYSKECKAIEGVDGPCITMWGDGTPPLALPMVQCVLADGETKGAAVSKDSQVTLKGRVTGSISMPDATVPVFVVLEDCAVVAMGDVPVPAQQTKPRPRRPPTSAPPPAPPRKR